ncbi:restriction endonuclease subunit S [Acetobacter musti]|uniref:Restriction endonuclease subunit S n=1 Tax=Acetobacter musti TaxID=864732 RepID=A0ABX0JUB7_9PROT|nr:restriction endonuclease subunit S [Acetobacter musti]NHN85565.1 restriction endonuclease subunit S [Acetobacter musti]
MTVDIASLVSDNLDIWTTAIERKSGLGRGGGNRINLYGIDRLRSLIVDLAVRGKLTSQQPDEEPAAMALAKFAKASRRKIELGQARKPKAVLPLPADLPNLPEGWVWTQLGTIAEISPSNSADDQVDASFVPMALVSTRIDGAHEAEIRRWSEIKKGFTHFAEGDIGLAKITPCFENGKAVIFENLANGIGAGTTELHVARPWSDDVNRRYLLLTMKTASYLHQGEARMTGTAGQKRVPRSYFESSPLPLPPLVEQQRIVTKVDELMALCDALETESASAIAAHQTLVEALLTTLTTSTDDADLATNWTRLEAHFDILFTTEASVDALKQTILELAVAGRLIASSGAVKQGTLEDAGEWVGGHGFPKQYQGNSTGEIPFLKVSDMNLPGNEREITVANNWVSPESLKSMKARAHPAGTIIFPKIGGAIATNKRRILSVSAAIDNNCAGQIPAKGINIDWLFMVLSSIDMTQYQAGTSVPALNMKRLAKHAIAIPNEDAQKVIITKVHDLMSLCELLAARVAASVETQRHLADRIAELIAA